MYGHVCRYILVFQFIEVSAFWMIHLLNKLWEIKKEKKHCRFNFKSAFHFIAKNIFCLSYIIFAPLQNIILRKGTAMLFY